MKIGIPKEIKQQEFRVALPPSAAYQLIKRGHQVLVETNAGSGAGFPDKDYEAAGAQIVKEHKVLFELADLIVKVKEPQESEYSLLRQGQILFTYLHLAANKALTEALMRSGVTALAYETIEVNRRLPCSSP
jgi:alanine dehydrogenase